MIIKHYCPFCNKLLGIEKIICEDRKMAKVIKENIKTINIVLGKNCEKIHN